MNHWELPLKIAWKLFKFMAFKGLIGYLAWKWILDYYT